MSSLTFQTRIFRGFDGADLHYVDVGSGQPMIYVCGFGSTIESQALLKVSADGGAGLAELYAPTDLAAAAEAGAAILKGGAMTEFEKLCDDAVEAYLAGAQSIPFGEAPLIAYLAARETEYTNLRILLLGRGAGLAPDLIRARLRRSCV